MNIGSISECISPQDTTPTTTTIKFPQVTTQRNVNRGYKGVQVVLLW